MRQLRRQARSMKSKKNTIAFRVSDEEKAILGGEAEKLGLGPNTHARNLCIGALYNEWERLFFEAIREVNQLLVQLVTDLQEVREVKQLILRLINNLKIITVALLADAGKATLQQAQEFVRGELS
jgi:hypothetical protein